MARKRTQKQKRAVPSPASPGSAIDDARVLEVAKKVVWLLMEEQREKHGQYADEEILRRGALARAKWIVAEGFAE